jgi:ribosomal protein S18 acetylase RimI-like enzyme
MSHENWIRLKSGKKVVIRSILFTDVNERHEFFVKLSLAQAGMVNTIDEIEIHTYETHDKINDFIRNKRGLWLVAVNPQKKIVGEIDITVKNFARVKHNGSLTIGILAEYQGQGLGSLLLEQAFLWANEKTLSRIELTVFANNEPAKALYQKYGFVVEGVRKNYLQNDDGSYEDDVLMAKYLTLLPKTP